jgi:hypothetical protein
MLATPPMKPRLRRFLEDGPLRRLALLCLGIAGLVMA